MWINLTLGRTRLHSRDLPVFIYLESPANYRTVKQMKRDTWFNYELEYELTLPWREVAHEHSRDSPGLTYIHLLINTRRQVKSDTWFNYGAGIWINLNLNWRALLHELTVFTYINLTYINHNT